MTTATLDDSYRLCRDVARRAARNFYYSFWVLPREKRRAMCALYAFFRRTDDLGDGDDPIETRRAALQAWRASLRQALAGDGDDPLLPALADTVARFQIPVEYLETAIDGVESDLDRSTFADTAELDRYCHQVASVVGLACIHVWGFRRDPAALDAAEHCGIAFQMTNILRDVAEDARRGRTYLPLADMARFGLLPSDLQAAACDDRLRALLRFEAERAEEHYRAAQKLLPFLSREGRGIYGAMVDIYHALLEKIRRRNYDVFSRRVSLPAWQKAALAARRMWPHWMPFVGSRSEGDER